MDDGEAGKKNPLVTAAERIARASSSMSGYLRKKKGAAPGEKAKWQKRYFQILPGAGGVSYFVYYKTAAADAPVLAAMDLSRAGRPELVAPAAEESGSDAVFAITWDRFREFQASSKAEAVAWVDAIARAQAAARKAGIPAPAAPAAGAAFSPNAAPGGGGKGGAARPGETSGLKSAGGGGGGGGCCVVA